MPLVLYHAVPSRSFATLLLLEELGLPYELIRLDLNKGEQRQAAFLAINPLGKVPTLIHDGAIITEQVAVTIYLGDLAPGGALAPAIGDPLRGPYLRWVAFYGASYEPALVDRALKREPGAQGMSPYGSYEAVVAALNRQLAQGPYLLGERFTAADALWGSALIWTTTLGFIERSDAIGAYIELIRARPAFLRATAIDAKGTS